MGAQSGRKAFSFSTGRDGRVSPHLFSYVGGEARGKRASTTIHSPNCTWLSLSSAARRRPRQKSFHGLKGAGAKKKEEREREQKISLTWSHSPQCAYVVLTVCATTASPHIPYITPLSTSLEGRFCKGRCCTETLFPYNDLAAKSSHFKNVFMRVDTILFDPLSHPDTASLDPP